MFEKIHISHYKLIILFSATFYPLWKVLDFFMDDYQEPWFCRLPSLILGIAALVYLHKKPIIEKAEKFALFISFLTTAEYIYLMFMGSLISDQVMFLYVLGGFVVFGTYLASWKKKAHVLLYSGFLLVTLTSMLLYSYHLAHKPIYFQYEILFLVQFIIVGGLNYKNIIESNKIAAQHAEDQLAIVSSKKLTHVSQMAGGIAHEMKNPLLAINMALGLIEMKSEAKGLSFSNEFKIIEEANQRIVNAIDTLLTFSQNKTVASGGIKIFNLKKIIENMIVICQNRFLGKMIEVENKCDFDIEILCDQTEISHMIYELLVNAFESIIANNPPIKKIKITYFVDINKSQVHINIFDSAPEIPLELVSKLFIPFFSTKDDLSKGYGTGLPISKGIVNSHGGDIQYLNNPKCFKIILPYQNIGIAQKDVA